MEKKGWRVLAIILLVVLLAENLLFGYAYSVVQKEEKQVVQCYYEICSGYPDAIVSEDNVCHCYDYDVLGNPEIVKSTILD